MANKTLIDVLAAPLVRKIAIYGATALAGAIVSWAVSKGWLDAATGQQIVDAVTGIFTGIGAPVAQ